MYLDYDGNYVLHLWLRLQSTSVSLPHLTIQLSNYNAIYPFIHTSIHFHPILSNYMQSNLIVPLHKIDEYQVKNDINILK